MSRHRGHQGRVDQNQASIVASLRAVGCEVLITSGVADGYPDLTVVTPAQGSARRIIWLECKRPGEHLTEREQAFAEGAGDLLYVVHSVEEALAVVGLEVQP